MRKPLPERIDLIREFNAAPDSTLFNQKTVAAVLACSTAKLERDRWAGTGLCFRRRGRNVLYKKSDVLAAINGMPAFQSTSAADAA